MLTSIIKGTLDTATASVAEVTARLRGDLDESIGETPTADAASIESIPILTLFKEKPSVESCDRGGNTNAGGGEGGGIRFSNELSLSPPPPRKEGDA